MLVEKRGLLGIGKHQDVECNLCGAVFVPKGKGYKLSKVNDTSSATWKAYGNKVLKEHEWANIANGGLSDEEQKSADMEMWLSELREGRVRITVGGDAPILPKRDEDIHIALDGVSLQEARAVRTGSYGGPSVRLSKGLYFRVGGFSAQSHDEIKVIDEGTFVVTNKRLIFVGKKRTYSVNLRKIISVEPFEDAVGISREGRQKVQYFTGLDRAKLTITIDGRKHVEKLSGLIIMYLIEGLVKQLG